MTIGGNITMGGANLLTFPSAVRLTDKTSNTPTITCSNGGITFSNTIDGSTAGTQSLTLVAGTGTVTFSGAVGTTTPLTNITFTSASLIQIGANITVTGANTLTFQDPVVLTAASTISNNNSSGAIQFSSTINSTTGTPYALTI